MSKDIVEVIENFKFKTHLKPATSEDVKSAEETLGLKFADEYIRYVLKYGAVMGDGNEYTGIADDGDSMSVVNATKQARELDCYDIPSNMYVIENLYIDGILGLQDEKGICYVIAPFTEPQKTADSLADYMLTYVDEVEG